MTLTTINHANVDELFEAAAKDFLQRFEQSLASKPYFDVALSGGSTAKFFFGFLVKVLMGHHHLARLRFFLSDERVVDVDSSDSNAGNAIRFLLTPLTIHRDQIFPMYDGLRKPDVCAREYATLVTSLVHTNADSVPVFDVIYLGIGQDGHTASLFPHSELLKDTTSLVCATKEASVPYQRITMMPRLINAAKHVCVLAYGPTKASVLDDIINGPELFQALPAQLIMRNHASNVVVMTADLNQSV